MYKRILTCFLINVLCCGCSTVSVSAPWQLKSIESYILNDYKICETVTCAVLDSGFSPEYKKYFDDNTVIDEINLTDSDEITSNLHGTFISVLISSIDYGVDSNIRILPIRIINDIGYTTSELILKGLETAKSNGCQVVNMSFGSKKKTAEIENFIQTECDKTYFVSSVGDLRQDEYYFPAAFDEVIAVSAVDENGTLYASSNVSTISKSVYAPGVNVELADAKGEKLYKSGSSFSAAIVSGIVASCLSRNKLVDDIILRDSIYGNAYLKVKDFMKGCY